jgi:hypothetical protein
MSETKTDWVEEVLAIIEADAKACDADAKRHKEKGDELNSYLMATQAMAHQLDIARFRKAKPPTPQVSEDLKELAVDICRLLQCSPEYRFNKQNVAELLQFFLTHRDAETKRVLESVIKDMEWCRQNIDTSQCCSKNNESIWNKCSKAENAITTLLSKLSGGGE